MIIVMRNWWAITIFSYYTSKMGFKGFQIPNICIFGSYIEFLFSFQFLRVSVDCVESFRLYMYISCVNRFPLSLYVCGIILTERVTKKCQFEHFYFSSNLNADFCKMLILMSYLWVNKEHYIFYYGKGTKIQKFSIFGMYTEFVFWI